MTALRNRVHKIGEGRLKLPREVPYTEAHNTWVVNHPGTLVVIPVGDLAQHVLLGLCHMLQNGLVLKDDIHGRAIPGIEKFKHLVDVENVWPLTFVEQWSLAELTSELSNSCYAGSLMLQAHHLDLEFYDTFYKPGSYLKSHSEHMERWHPRDKG